MILSLSFNFVVLIIKPIEIISVNFIFMTIHFILLFLFLILIYKLLSQDFQIQFNFKFFAF